MGPCGRRRTAFAALRCPHLDIGRRSSAFYAQFDSKDGLVATVVADQLRGQRERFNVQVTDSAEIEQFVREYLSVVHRDNPQDGCPSAALLNEIARCTDATERTYTNGGWPSSTNCCPQ